MHLPNMRGQKRPPEVLRHNLLARGSPCIVPLYIPRQPVVHLQQEGKKFLYP